MMTLTLFGEVQSRLARAISSSIGKAKREILVLLTNERAQNLLLPLLAGKRQGWHPGPEE
jgi:hypothetical protein